MTKDIVTLHITTKHGDYSIPNVDLEKYRHSFEPGLDHNPCLQVINESYGVLSLTWSEVLHVHAQRAVPSALEAGKTYRVSELLWQSAA
jgi:hypothetical protein